MASELVKPLQPTIQFLDKNGNLTPVAYDFLANLRRMLLESELSLDDVNLRSVAAPSSVATTGVLSYRMDQVEMRMLHVPTYHLNLTRPGPIGSMTPSTGSFTTIRATGQITSTVTTGTPPFVVASATLVPNLNASLFLDQSWIEPGPVGALTPDTGDFTTLTASAGFAQDGDLGFYGVTPIPQITVTGARGGNAALQSLLEALEDLGLINDTTTA
jgi:hypothetical protein